MFDKEFSHNTIKSISCFNPLKSLSRFVSRARILSKHQETKDFEILKENALRVYRISKDATNNEINSNLFNTQEEKALFEAISNHKQSSDDLDSYITSLNSLTESIVAFFDKVLVMDKDENIKNNRLALLNQLKQKFDVVCDFEKL